MNSPYTLEKYTGIHSRYTCPKCGKPNQFTRFINSNTGEHVAETVGICNRINKCGYKYLPGEYFKDNGNKFIQYTPVGNPESNKKINSPSYVPYEIFNKSFIKEVGILSIQNNFIYFLINHFGIQRSLEALERFKIGTSKHWPGATVFWQIDTSGNVRTGKIMLYDKQTGKRIKKPYNHITWVHSILEKKGSVYNFNLQQCLFGLHQVYTESTRPIGIVESEKTAIIASIYLPELIWMATGGIQNLNPIFFDPIANRNIILFPDLNGYTLWKGKADAIKKELKINFNISDLLERKGSSNDKEEGFDLADFLMN